MIRALPLLLLLAGCAALKSAEQPVTIRLSPTISRLQTPLSIDLAPVSARGVAADRRYAYRDRAAPAEIRQAATLFWELPPPQAVARALRDGLPPPRPGPAIRLTAVVDRFEELTGSGQPTLATIALDLTATRAGAPVLTTHACATAPVAGAMPSDRARAFETALAAVVAQTGQLLANPGAATGC